MALDGSIARRIFDTMRFLNSETRNSRTDDLFLCLCMLDVTP